MKKENTQASIPEADLSRITFVKAVCSQIQQALEDISDVFEKVTKPIPNTSSLGKSQGIGLFLYIRDKESALKQQYPQFTDDEIVRILLTQWQMLSDTEKQQYCSKVNDKKSKKTKKQKKLEKMFEKLVETVSNTEQGGSLDKGQGSPQSLSLSPKAKSKYFAIEEEEEEDSMPKKKMPTGSQIFAQDITPVDKTQIEEDNQAKRTTPSFQKLEFDVIHQRQQNQQEKEQPGEDKQKAMVKAVDQNLMEIEQSYKPSPELKQEVQVNKIPEDIQEIAPLSNSTLQNCTHKDQKANEQQQPQKPSSDIQICASQNPPSQIPPSDDIISAISNQVQSTKQCESCLGAEQIPVQDAVEENRDLIDNPVLILCPSQSNSLPLPLPQISRDSQAQAQQEKLSQPKIEHHESSQVSQNEERNIVPKLEVPELSEIDHVKPKVEYKQDNQNPFFDQKGEDLEGIHEIVTKQGNGNALEIPQLFNFKSLKQECKVQDEQKQSGTSMNESIEQKLIKMEVKQDNTCIQQQEQLEFD